MPWRGLCPQTSIDFMESLRLGLAYTKLSYQQKFVENRFYNARDLFRFDLVGHYSCVNALDVSRDHAYLASGGDCMRVLVWDLDRAFCMRDYQAAEMKAKHESNIFAVAFTPDKRTLFSGGNDGMIIAHDPQTGEVIRSCELPWQVISSISVNPHQPHVCMVATCDSIVNGIMGQTRANAIYLFDLRVPWQLDHVGTPEISIDGAPHCVQYNPVRPHCIATADSKNGLLQWDLRVLSNHEMRYLYEDPADEGVMSLAWSSDGNRLASLPKRDSPRLYVTGFSRPIATFSAEGFANGCTLKSVTFAGPNEEYVVTGSDSFQVYMWRHDSVSRPDSSTYDVIDIAESSLTLTGHRSIVNQVRYCPRHYCLFSSGVEKMIKVWSIFSSPRAQGSLSGRDKAPQRKRREPCQLGSLPVIGQISNDSVEEDPMMLLFFDRLLYEDETSDDSILSDIDDIRRRRRQLSPVVVPPASDDSNHGNDVQKKDEHSVSSNVLSDDRMSSDEEQSTSSSSRPQEKRARVEEETDSGSSRKPRSSRPRLLKKKRPGSERGVEAEQPSSSGQKRKRGSKSSKRRQDSSSDSATTSSSLTTGDAESLSSLSSLPSGISSPKSSTKEKKSSDLTNDDIPQNSCSVKGPPKNMRPSFRETDSDVSSDDG